MKDNRPTNLNLTTIKFPLPAITSILHRISGAFLFFAVAVLLYLLDLSLSSEAGFQEVTEMLTGPLAKFVIWLILAGLAYHFVAGCKHLIMDMGIGETLEGGRFGAIATIVVFLALAAALGVWIW